MWQNPAAIQWGTGTSGDVPGNINREDIRLHIDSLSDVPLFAARPQPQVPPKRKAATWIVVGIVHLLMLNLLMFSQNFPSLVRRGVEHETILDLSGNPKSETPAVRMVPPQAPVGTPPQIPMAPVPLPPPVVETPQRAQREGNPEGDLLGAVGRELACAAGNYENLNPVQRARCPRAPWQGAIAPDGTIVLATPQPRNRFAPPPREPVLSGADAQRLSVERNNPCPVMLNVPCLNQIPGR